MTQAQMFLRTLKACDSKDFFCFFFPFLRNYLPFEKQKLLWAVQLQHLKNEAFAAPGGLESFLVSWFICWSSIWLDLFTVPAIYSSLFTVYLFRFLLTLTKFFFSKTGQICSCGFSPYAYVANQNKSILHVSVIFTNIWYLHFF